MKPCLFACSHRTPPRCDWQKLIKTSPSTATDKSRARPLCGHHAHTHNAYIIMIIVRLSIIWRAAARRPVDSGWRCLRCRYGVHLMRLWFTQKVIKFLRIIIDNELQNAQSLVVEHNSCMNYGWRSRHLIHTVVCAFGRGLFMRSAMTIIRWQIS